MLLVVFLAVLVGFTFVTVPLVQLIVRERALGPVPARRWRRLQRSGEDEEPEKCEGLDSASVSEAATLDDISNQDRSRNEKRAIRGLHLCFALTFLLGGTSLVFGVLILGETLVDQAMDGVASNFWPYMLFFGPAFALFLPLAIISYLGRNAIESNTRRKLIA